MSNIVVTNNGLNFIAQAGVSGPYFPIKYFSLLYDERYDSAVHAPADTSAISSSESSSSTTPVGEIIYNVESLTPGSNVYSISNNEFLIHDPTSSTSVNGSITTVINNDFDALTTINLLNGTPLSSAISGTAYNRSGTDWQVTNYTFRNGVNNIPSGYANSRDRFFKSITYIPVSVNGGNTLGQFRIRLNSSIGNFKFNKVALYAAKILANGTEDMSVEPVLVAIALLKDTITKTNDGLNISFFELDVEFSFSSVASFSQISYLSDNAWSNVAGYKAISYMGEVAIGSSAVPGSFEPKAKLQLTGDSSAQSLTRYTLTSPSTNQFVDVFYSDSSVSANNLEYRSSGNSVVYEWKNKIISNSFYSSGKISLGLNGAYTKRRFDLIYTDGDGTKYTGLFAQYYYPVEVFSLITNNFHMVSMSASDDGTSTMKMSFGKDSNTLFGRTGYFSNFYGGLNVETGNLNVQSGSLFVGANNPLYTSGVPTNSLKLPSAYLFGADKDFIILSDLDSSIYIQTSGANRPIILMPGLTGYSSGPTFDGVLNGISDVCVYGNLILTNGGQIGTRYAHGGTERIPIGVYARVLDARNKLVIRTNIDESLFVTSREMTLSANATDNSLEIKTFGNLVRIVGDLRLMDPATGNHNNTYLRLFRNSTTGDSTLVAPSFELSATGGTGSGFSFAGTENNTNRFYFKHIDFWPLSTGIDFGYDGGQSDDSGRFGSFFSRGDINTKGKVVITNPLNSFVRTSYLSTTHDGLLDVESNTMGGINSPYYYEKDLSIANGHWADINHIGNFHYCNVAYNVLGQGQVHVYFLKYSFHGNTITIFFNFAYLNASGNFLRLKLPTISKKIYNSDGTQTYTPMQIIYDGLDSIKIPIIYNDDSFGAFYLEAGSSYNSYVYFGSLSLSPLVTNSSFMGSVTFPFILQ